MTTTVPTIQQKMNNSASATAPDTTPEKPMEPTKAEENPSKELSKTSLARIEWIVHKSTRGKIFGS
jgi:hypothetical protein